MAQASNIEQDARYTAHKEYLGYANSQMLAVRFCGDWIGTASNKSKALEIMEKHNVDRFL